MPISDPRDRFFYPHHTPMKDIYSPVGENKESYQVSFITINRQTGILDEPWREARFTLGIVNHEYALIL